MRLRTSLAGLSALFLAMLPETAPAWTPLAVTNDFLVRMPGTQPGQVTLESPNNCTGCHEFDPAVDPFAQWGGSMMAQCARDPLFYACFTVAAQDAIWAVGNPNAADLCMRCHFPEGWLEGRSDPPNASLMTGSDFDGVHCTVCHEMVDPFFKATYDGTREGADWTGYWDETDASSTPSSAAALTTLSADEGVVATLSLFNGFPMYDGSGVPVASNYTENASGQFVVAGASKRTPRAPFADAGAKHDILYSRYHKSKYFCGTCHDVSNPVLRNLGANPADPLPSETENAASFLHVERTFSEFMLSGYALPGGMPGSGPFAPEVFDTMHPSNHVASCQDCHVPSGSGQACNKTSGVDRPAGSTEHPNSGLPLHFMAGGNCWIPAILASTVPGSPNYDAVNEGLLENKTATLTLDLNAGQGLNPEVLLAGVSNALNNLEAAASITHVTYNPVSGECSFRVVNHTGHKLISGFPEGRRMFVNIRVYAHEVLVYEVNPYDVSAGTLKGLDPERAPASPALAAHEVYRDDLVYEMHPRSSITGEDETFHFVLADSRYKDNRIPPAGFRVAESPARHAEPVWHGVSDTNYFTATEYALGCDDVHLLLPKAADEVEIKLYQTTSREYIEFLRDEINGTGNTLSGTGAGGDPPYLIQTNAWFAALKAWGDTIWQLWDHNRNLPGAAPVAMTDLELELDRSDEDGDGLPGYWETLYFGGPTNAVATADADGDGILNGHEFIAFSHPLVSNQVFKISDMNLAGPRLALTFPSLFARRYVLQHNPDAVSGTWSNVPPDSAGCDDLLTVTHTNAPPGLYRMTIRLP